MMAWDWLDVSNASFWWVLSIVLIVFEMITVAYFALGFAFASVVVGILVQFVLTDFPLWMWVLWSGLGLAFWYALSMLFARRHASKPDINKFDSLESLSKSDREKKTRWSTPTQSYDTSSHKHAQKGDPAARQDVGVKGDASL